MKSFVTYKMMKLFQIDVTTAGALAFNLPSEIEDV